MKVYIYETDTGDALITEKVFRHKPDAELYKLNMNEIGARVSEIDLIDNYSGMFIYTMAINTDSRFEKFKYKENGNVEPSWEMKIEKRAAHVYYPVNSRIQEGRKTQHQIFYEAEFPLLHITLSASCPKEAKDKGTAIYFDVRQSTNWENLIAETGFNIKDFPKYEDVEEVDNEGE